MRFEPHPTVRRAIALAVTATASLLVSLGMHAPSATAVTPGSWPGSGGPVAANQQYGYPYASAPDCNETTGGSCAVDRWSFYQGQCTSWVSFRISQLDGIAFNNSYGGGGRWSDATNWGPHARALGIPVNGTPAVGSVAWYSSGHVGVVEQVLSSTSVVMSEMNYDYHNGFKVHTITTASGWPTGFIHIHDAAGGGNATNGYESAFQANTGSLFNQGDIRNGDAKLGMAAGTSPGVAVLSNGGSESVMQANTGNMFVYGDAGSADTGQGMAAWTSPSIAASPAGGFETAFQANTGSLYTYSLTTGPINRQLGMAAGTSPAIAALPGGGYEMAFQANTGDLWVVGDSQNVDTHQGMQAGTSPTIAASRSGGFKVAFQANTGSLYTYTSTTGAAADWQLGMAAGTSPAIAALPGTGYEVAFQANTGNLWVVGDSQNADTRQGMKTHTSPAIAASPAGGFQTVFQANTGSMYWYRSTTGPADLQLGMDNITSPCVSSALGGGCAPAAPASPSTIRTPRLASGVVGKRWAATLSAAGGSDPYSWSISAGKMPTGLTLTPNGRISGTPTRGAITNITFRITDTLGGRWSNTKTIQLKIAAVAIRTTTLPTGHANHVYSANLSAYGNGPMTWAITSGKVPRGIALTRAGHLGGKPSKAGKATITVKVTTATQATTTRKLTLTVR